LLIRNYSTRDTNLKSSQQTPVEKSPLMGKKRDDEKDHWNK